MKLNIVAKNILLLLCSSGIVFSSYSLSGRVIENGGDDKGIKGALIKLVNADLSTTTSDDGSFSIKITGTHKPLLNKRLLTYPEIKGNTLNFVVDKDNQSVKVSVFSLNGRLIYDVIDKRLPADNYHLNLQKKTPGTNIYAIKLQIGNQTFYMKMPVINSRNITEIPVHKENASIFGRLEKRVAVIDTLKVSKTGYISVSKPVTSYDNSFTIALDVYVPLYHLNPPDPCYNQFYAKGCIKGDPNSACGGNCTVANSCSPPEDASKANLPKTFICPRFMLFSTEMLQAAKDDARLYGWNEDDPPFNYAVVGHDPDIGGVDDTSSSCCQCYQIIFKTPEPSSPKPPDLPYPKSLIVQSFNTAASGPYGFDVFMGAGGYGAFNSCYDDPNFPNTSNFDEFIYDEYPYQNPGSGGISFLRCSECIKGWPVTVDVVNSTECQQKIESLCNQALVKSSDQITEDTRRSCIQTNKIESLYHQNWEVMVKRVRCPDNLTRVTGCRLKEPDLSLPHPNVQTPDQAKANGTFKDGYHTTTMQDCCKPTCAWSDWVGNYGLPVDGEWNSFYSCDKNGIPVTK